MRLWVILASIEARPCRSLTRNPPIPQINQLCTMLLLEELGKCLKADTECLL